MKRPGKYGELILDIPENRKNIARYLWAVFTEATQFRNSDFPDDVFVIDTNGPFPVSASFDDMLAGNIEKVAQKYNLPGGLDTFRREEPLVCAFYLINCLQEHLLSSESLDRYGRYPFAESIQYAHQITEVNYVQEIFEDIYKAITDHYPTRYPSLLFWTHDIDYLYSAWKSDLILAGRANQISQKLQLIRKAITQPYRWNNVETLVELEKQYDIQSVFFWLTESGKATVSKRHRIDHADYNIQSRHIKKLWQIIIQAGSVNGIHKSAFDLDFRDELCKMPTGVTINRNHFLKFRLPDHFDQVEQAGLKYDASLGFAEHHGFRNSFGRPFQPYNLRKNRPYRFVEFPLHLMDATFQTYLGQGQPQMIETVMDFIHRNRFSSIISILIHNNQVNFDDHEAMQHWHRLFAELSKMEQFRPTDF